MPESLSFTSLISSATHWFQNTKAYFSSAAEPTEPYTFEPFIGDLEPDTHQIQTDEIDERFNAKSSSKSFSFNQLFITAAIVGLIGSRNSLRFGMSALVAAPVVAYPNVSNLIPTQYVQPGQLFDDGIDLNWIFSDFNQSMTFATATMPNDDLLPSWLSANPPKLFGRAYAYLGGYFDIDGSIAYVSTDSALQAYDISNPFRKLLIGEFKKDGILFVEVENGVAHLILSKGIANTYLSVDVTNPRAMYQLSNCSLNSAGNMYKLIVNAGKAYLATSFGLYIIEHIQNIPTLSGPVPDYAPFGLNSLALQNDTIYLSASHAGVYFVNLTTMNFTYVLDTPGEVYDVLPTDNYLFVADYPFGVRVVDLTNYNIVANYSMPIDATKFAMATNNILYVTASGTTVYAFDVSNITSPNLLKVFNTTDALYNSKILAVNDTLFAVNPFFGLVSFNVQNTSNIVPGIEPDLPVHTVAVNGDIIYTVEDAHIAIRDISNPTYDRLLARFPIPRDPNSIAVINDWLLIPDENAELLLADVSDPRNPRFDHNISLPSFISEVMTVDNRAVAVSQGANSFYLFDFSNANSPTWYGPYFLSRITDAFILDERLFTTGDTVSIFDITNLTNPIFITDLPYYRGVISCDDNFILLGSTQPSLFALLNVTNVDVNNTREPTLVAFYNDPTTSSYIPIYVNDVAYRNRLIYTASGWGFQIYNHTNGNLSLLYDYRLFPDAPNLFATQINLVANRLYVTAGDTGLHIFDLSRVRVSGLVPQNASGSYVLEIHATNQNGEWISTNLEIVIGSAPNVTSSLMTTSVSASQIDSSSSSVMQSSLSSDISASNSAMISSDMTTAQTSSSKSSQQSSLVVTISSDAIHVDDSGVIQIPAGYLSIQSNLPPDQIIITGSISLDSPYSLIENDIFSITLASMNEEGAFVSLDLQGVTCGEYSGDLNLHITAGDQERDVSVSLIFDITTCSQSPRSVSRDPLGVENGIALAASARGFFAVSSVGLAQGLSAIVDDLPSLKPF